MAKSPKPQSKPVPRVELTWQKAAYHLHTFAYRDPRSAFASGIGLPVVSPTTVLLGIVSSLFSIGEAEKAKTFMEIAHQCDVLVDAPDGVVFFRAFHQLRRYHTFFKGKDPKKGPNPRYGFTTINQGTREYGLIDGVMTVYVGVPKEQSDAVNTSLMNLRHLGTNDSLCSLVGKVEECSKPDVEDVIYMPRDEFAQKIRSGGIDKLGRGVTMVTLSRFKRENKIMQTLEHWKMAGDTADTELLAYAIPGSFLGTSRGKIYRKKLGSA